MSKKITLLGVAVAASAVVAYLGLSVGERHLDPGDAAALDDETKDRRAAGAAMSQIAAESKAIDASGADAGADIGELAVQAAAPPGFVPAPVEHEAAPPEGYSFAAHRDVERGPMTAADLDRDQPPAAAPGWMAYGDDALAEQAAAAGRDWSFGWVKLADGSDVEGLRELLAATGGEVLGQSGDLVRARLPGDPGSLRVLAASDRVAGLGALPARRKVTGALVERAVADVNAEVPVWITLMSDDPDGRWRGELKRLGAEVGGFDPAIRTYPATIPMLALGPISAADFVLAVESIGRVEPALEIATAAMGADALRSYDMTTRSFTGVGGASVTVGVMDTSLSVDHADIWTNRRSICGANFSIGFSYGGNVREDDQDLWFGDIGHGTAVTGIALGNGAMDPSRAGVAPLVQDIRFARIKSNFGDTTALGWSRAMDWFAKPTACGDGVPRKAQLINASLGVFADLWEGRSAIERKVDASVWAARQLFVAAAGNGANESLRDVAAAKNALAVGATQNIGDIASLSSVGPTADGRLMPNVVGTGVEVMAPRASAVRLTSDSPGGNFYWDYTGTSMSSPAVAGVAALVMDAVPELKGEPAALRAHLMASAIKPDAFMGDADAFPLDNTDGPGSLQNFYGLGKVSARTAVLSRDRADGWTGGSAAFDVDADSHAYHDIVVPEGASRLDVVMTWDEPAADSIASPVLHDLDLWVDRSAACGDIAACGRHASRSRIDNVEWVIVPNPPPGVYRLKVLPNRIYGPAPRAGLAWTVIRGDSTPTLGVAADTDAVAVAPGEPFDIAVTMSNDAYVAAGANLRVDCRAEVGSQACDGLSYAPADSRADRADGLERTLVRDGASIVVGEIGPDERQTVSLRFPGRPEGSFRLHFSAAAWNGNGATASVGVVVGEPGSAPPPATGAPSNDAFANATVLAGAGGEVAFELLTATPDPGEPAFSLSLAEHPQRERSIWYVWTAPKTGLARFSVPQAVQGDYADFVVVEAYPDGPLAGLEALGTGLQGGGATFFADEGETYRIRLAIDSGSHLASAAKPDLVLRWGPGSRPGNDDYGHAASIEGGTGTLEGNNQGATTEPGELMGNANPTTITSVHGWGASVWYDWTAPSTGDFSFSVFRRALLVAVFAGDSLAEARLVSGMPAGEVVFPATEGVRYKVAVASSSAYFSASDFTLSWAPGTRESPANDDFAGTASAAGGFAGAISPNELTVEHGEPAESGVRTAWWTWQAPADGRYTWLGSSSGLRHVPLQMSVFEGDDVADLQLVAVDTGDETLELQMVFDAAAGATYRLALGLPRDAALVSIGRQFVVMEWGETPQNDNLADAAMLVGATGTVGGSNEFATNEKGEQTGTLGDSSLWWTFEPEEAGWMRFVVDGPRGSKLAIYKVGADGRMQLVAVSRSLGDVAANFRAEAGARYVVRLGSYYYDTAGYGRARRGSFEITWAPSDAPAVLRYVGLVADGQAAGDGTAVDLGTLGDQAFNTAGTELYAATSGGIVVFDRDPATGELSVRETLADHPVSGSGTELIWDEEGNALIVASCDAWLKFTPKEGGGLEHAGEIDGAPCATGGLLLRGDLVHSIVGRLMIETYRFDEAHDAVSLEDSYYIPGLAMAAVTTDGAHMYALTEDGDENELYVMERDADAGTLRIVRIVPGGEDPGVERLAEVKAMVLNSSHLFMSVGSGGADTLVFDLADPANPKSLGVREGFVIGASYSNCSFALARPDVAAVDVACVRNANVYTVQAAADGTLVASDYVRAIGIRRDAFGNPIPDHDTLRSFAASPDGGHVYMAGDDRYFFYGADGFVDVITDQILVFERVYEAADSAETED